MSNVIALPRPFSATRVVGVCILIAVLEGYDIQAIGVAAPTLAPALKLGPQAVGLAGSMAMVGLIFGAALGGWIADRVGRRPVLVVSAACFGLFSLMTAVAGDAQTLLLSRFLTGLGFGGAMPNMIAMAGEASAPRRRISTVTAIFVGMPAGGALAALLARFLPAGFDWRLIFVVGGVAPLVIAPLAAFVLPETLSRSRSPAAAAGGRPLNALFGDGRALPTLLLWSAFAATLVVLSMMLAWLPLLVVAKGLPKDLGASAALAFNGAGIVGGLAVGGAIDRWGARWPLLTALALLAAGMGLLAAAAAPGAVLALSALAGLGVMGAQFSLYALAPRYYPAAAQATGAGAAVGAGRIGSILGPILAGTLRAAHAGPGETLAWTAPVVAIAALSVLILTQRDRQAFAA
ncbi:MFS transporter [Caulobacter sp. KR2-114]|uniref:MFS transporter n=1 Tax=Caulobacter sp. KR2-114 TaxID=3400912 RepID=UPI003C04399C